MTFIVLSFIHPSIQHTNFYKSTAKRIRICQFLSEKRGTRRVCCLPCYIVTSLKVSKDEESGREWDLGNEDRKNVGADEYNLGGSVGGVQLLSDTAAMDVEDDERIVDIDSADDGDDDDDDGGDDALLVDVGGDSDAGTELFTSRSPLISESLHEYWVRRQADIVPEAEPSDNLGESYDTWATSVPEKKFRELRNLYGRAGVHIAHNFYDFVPGEYRQAVEDMSLEDQALYKAFCVYKGTGFPAIALTTEFRIAPMGHGGQVNYTRDLGEMERMIMTALPVSPPERKTLFRSVAAFCDGEREIYRQQEVEVDMVYCDIGKLSIAHAGALDRLYEELADRLGLDPSRFENEAEERDAPTKKLLGSTHLRERILREAEVLGNSMLKVSSFLNHQVDPVLVEECGEELAERLRSTLPTKVLAAEATGMIPSLSLARKLRVPVVFARRRRVLSDNDSYQVSYRSETKGEQDDLIVSTEYLGKDDRVLICDDFLASGSTVEALAKLCRMAGSQVVGVGVLVEKIAGGGRNFLAGYKVPVLSLAKVAINTDNTLTLVSEPVVEVEAESTI